MTRSLILLAHGSQDPRHADSVNHIAGLVSRELGSAWSVRTSYLQHHGPTVTHEFGAALQADELPVSILPLLLTAGEHWLDDVPALTSEATAKPEVELLEPLEPVELLPAVLEALEALESLHVLPPPKSFDDPRHAAEAPSPAPTPRPAESASAVPPASSPNPASSATRPLRHIVLVAGGSRVQDLRKHFEPLAAQLERILGPSTSDRQVAHTQQVCIDLLTRPAEIPKLRYSGPAVQIVPLLVSPGRIHDAILHGADKIHARVTVPIGQTDAFARAIAARALSPHAPMPSDQRHWA